MNGQNVEVGPDSGTGHKPSQESSPGRRERLAWLPIPLLLAAIIIARAAGLRESYMSEPLRLVLSFTFYTAVSLGTLFLIGRSFLASGKPGLLLLECGVILWSLAGTVGDIVAPRDANVNATIFNAVIFFAGLCHLAGAVLSLRPQRALRSPPLWLVVGPALALAALWFVTHAALAGWLPVFFVPGQGGTMVRYCVLVSAIVAFALSAGLLLVGRGEARAPFTSWYALAMLSLAVGLFGIMIQLSFGSVVNWLARTAQWLGGLYLLIAAIAALRESDLPLLPSVGKSSPRRYQYGVAIAIVLAATAARFALSPALKMSSPFLTFYPAVILAALYGGLRAGLLATALSAPVADYFWMEPVGQFAIESPTDWITMLFFLLSCTMISLVIEAMHKARARLILHQDHLEELVKNRTAELEREVAERRRAEETVRESEERLRLLVEGAQDYALFMLDELGCVVSWNTGAERIKGWTSGEILGQHFSRFYPQELINRGEPQRELEIATASAQYHVEGQRLRKDGSSFWADVTITALRDADGRLRGFGKLIRDITDRKLTEEALRESEAKYRNLFENMAEEVHFWKLVRDESGQIKTWRVVDVNPPALKTWERKSLEDTIGRTADEIYPGATDHYMAVVQKIMTEGVPYSFEDYFPPPVDKYFRFTSVPFGEYFITTGADITGIKKAQIALQKAHDELELRVQERTAELQQAYDRLKEETEERERIEAQLRQAQKMEALGTMSGGIAHDFNNILAAIIGFTELLEGHTSKGSRDARHLHRIMEAGIRGRELVRQMLTFSRKAEQEKKPLALGSIVRETVKLLRATTPSTISMKVNAASEALILGDPTQIQQLLMNLCTNAAYAMQEKGGILDIELSDYSVSQSNGDPHGIAPGQYVKLSVRDTGTGISADIMDKIFDPFFTTKKLGEGTGLGLSVVHGIVKQHDGHITVISEPGRGSTFTAYFPRIMGGLDAAAIHDDEIPTGSERILFVDDEDALVEMGEDILAELGYEVTSRMSSREALALFRLDPSRFDLVITDQTMPEMTGIELAREVLALRPDIPIIMATGFSHIVDADKAKAAGVRAFAMKPLTKREIAKTIRKALDG